MRSPRFLLTFSIGMLLFAGCQPGAECVENPGGGVDVVCGDGSQAALCEWDMDPTVREMPDCDERTAEASCPDGYTLACFD